MALRLEDSVQVPRLDEAVAQPCMGPLNVFFSEMRSN